MGRRLYAAALLGGLAGVCAAAAQQPSPQNTQPRPPVFRAGAHYVRVDAYPTGKDGKIVEGLKKDDFEIYEDGRPQAIENAEYITFDTWTPDAERKDPRTQQDAYDLAADPTWRVFVIVIDRPAYGMQGQHYMRGPLHEFIDRNLGPRDLFGLLTTENSPADLVLGQQTIVANAVLDRQDWLMPQSDLDDRFQLYYDCGMSRLIGRRRLDDTYSLLEGLVTLLGLVRQEKKGIVFVAEGLATPGPMKGDSDTAPPDPPRIGITNGRVGEMPRSGDRVGGVNLSSACAAERLRLVNLDFAERFRDLLTSARQANVAFYPISPAGLQGMPFSERGGIDMGAYHAQMARADSLRSLASETDGIAIIDTNNLAGGMRSIADDLHAYYVLGYYTSNTTWDGKVRSIKVRLKPKRPSTRLGTGDTIRARRQYRAPTLAEIAALSAAASPGPPAPPSAEDNAMAVLSSARPSAEFWSYAALAGRDLAIVLEIPGGAAGASRWPTGADVQALAETTDGETIGSGREKLGADARGVIVHVPLEGRGEASAALIRVRSGGLILTDRVAIHPASSLVGDPIAYRNGTAVAVLSCSRTDTVRFEWPVLAALERSNARLLDAKGHPLATGIPLNEKKGPAPVLVAELPLAPLGRGEYLVEVVATGAGATERKLTALRVR
jgi:VWFA-related protein